MTNRQIKFLTFFIIGIISSASLLFVFTRTGQSGGTYSRSGMYIKLDVVTGCYYLEGTAGVKTPLLEENDTACIKEFPEQQFTQQ